MRRAKLSPTSLNRFESGDCLQTKRTDHKPDLYREFSDVGLAGSETLRSRMGHATSRKAANGPKTSVRRIQVHADRFRASATPGKDRYGQPETRERRCIPCHAVKPAQEVTITGRGAKTPSASLAQGLSALKHCRSAHRAAEQSDRRPQAGP